MKESARGDSDGVQSGHKMYTGSGKMSLLPGCAAVARVALHRMVLVVGEYKRGREGWLPGLCDVCGVVV